jgi:hypothetical protein
MSQVIGPSHDKAQHSLADADRHCLAQLKMQASFSAATSTRAFFDPFLRAGYQDTDGGSFHADTALAVSISLLHFNEQVHDEAAVARR